MTLTEVLVVIIVLAVLIFIFLPNYLSNRPHPAYRSQCVNNLKQIGLAYRVWAGDHNDKFPMELSVTNGGTMGLADGRNAWINFFVMSNELSTPKVLICPLDTKSILATNWGRGFNNLNISYFIGLNADQDHPHVFLSGDDNFTIGGFSVKSGLLELSTNIPIAWADTRHEMCGNIVLADGSVQLSNNGSVQLPNNSSLPNLLRQTGAATNRLAIP